MIKYLQAQLPENGLADTELKVIQNPGTATQATVPAIAQASAKVVLAPKEENEAIEDLRKQLSALTDKGVLLERVSKEVGVLFPEIESFSWGDLLVKDAERIDPERVYTVLVKWKSSGKHESSMAKLSVFLRLRIQTENLAVIAVDTEG